MGLCLALALAQAGVRVTLVEELGDDNFLEQVPRAGTNHPATLEMLDRIGLYDKIEPRGIIAPVFHYWDRREGLVAAFDHAVLKDDTRFPYVLQCERIKIVEEALKLAKQRADTPTSLASRVGFTCARLCSPLRGPPITAERTRGRPLPRQRRRGARHRARGAGVSPSIWFPPIPTAPSSHRGRL